IIHHQHPKSFGRKVLHRGRYGLLNDGSNGHLLIRFRVHGNDETDSLERGRDRCRVDFPKLADLEEGKIVAMIGDELLGLKYDAFISSNGECAILQKRSK